MLTHKDFSELAITDPSTGRDGRLFALVDHAAIPGLANKLTRVKVPWISLFEGSRDEGALSVAPLLFPIGVNQKSPQQTELFNWIGQRGTYSSSLLFLMSPLSMVELSCGLARRLDAALPDEMDVFLRYFDTRVFESLLSVLSELQLRHFLSIGSSWWFCDRFGKLRHVSGSYTAHDSFVQPMVISSLQEAELLDASEADQVAELLLENVPREFSALTPGENFEFIIRHMTAAKLFGVQTTHEHAIYCTLALLNGENFIIEDKWTRALQDFKNKRHSLIQAIKAAEINEWENE